MDPRLLELIVCPVCKGPLELHKAAPAAGADAELRCAADRLRFDVRDGIPILLEAEARPWPTDTP